MSRGTCILLTQQAWLLSIVELLLAQGSGLLSPLLQVLFIISACTAHTPPRESRAAPSIQSLGKQR